MNPHRRSSRRNPHLPRLAYLVSALLILSLLGWAGIPAPAAPPAPTLTLHSPAPGELHLTWPAPTPAPAEYHIQYAPTDTPLLIQEATSPTNTLTLYDLEPGVVYTVQVRAGTGPWSVPVLQRIDDYRADPETVGTIGVGAEEVGYIESAGDADWFFVDLTAGEDYPIAVLGATDPPLAVYDATGGAVQQGVVWHQASALTFTPATAELYHLAVGGPAAEPGRYTLTVAEPSTAEPRRPRPLAGTEPTAPPAPRSPTAEPDKPRGLTATASHGQVVLTWNDPGDATITGYVILRRVRVNDTGGDFSVLVANTGTAALTYTDATVAASLTYTYRIKAINAHGVSERSRWYHIDTPAAPAPEEEQAAEPPSKPRGLAATATHDSVTLTWDDPGDATISGYVILRRIPGVDPEGQFSELVSDTGSAATTYTDATVSAATRYTYRIKALNGAGTSARSRWVHINVPAAPGAPGPSSDAGSGPSVSEGPTDLPHDNTTPGRVAVGGAATGRIGSNGDRDWYAVELVAGRSYVIDLRGSPTDDGTLRDPLLHGIYDAGGNRISGTLNDDGGQGYNSRVSFTAPESGTHYIAAGAYSSRQGTYELEVTDTSPPEADGSTTNPVTPEPQEPTSEFVGPDEDAQQQPETSQVQTEPMSVSEGDTDLPTDTTTPGRVVVGSSATGEVGTSGDRDWFAVDLEAGKTYRFDLKGSRTNDGTLYDPYLRGIHDADGEPIANTTNNNSGSGWNSRVYFTPDEEATYYVAAGAFGGYRGTYTLSVTEIPDDYAAEPDPATTGTVAVGGSVVGDIEAPGDEDWFAVELEAGKTYRVDLKGAATSDGTLSAPYLNGIHDADGNRIANTTDNNSGTGSNSRVYFTPDEDGTYYVAADGYRIKKGTYTLSVTDVTDDYADYAAEPDPDTTGTVTVGGSATGEIHYGGDEDWFAVELEAGATYRFDLKGSRTDDGTLTDPYLRGIHDAVGNEIPGTQNDDSGEHTNSRVDYTPDEDGTYYVAAGAYTSRTGTYTLSVIKVSDDVIEVSDDIIEVSDDYAAEPDPATTGTVAVGGSARGTIEAPGDQDWFAVELEAGKIYRFDLEGSWYSDGTLFDPYLRGIHDAGGERIDNTSDDDEGRGFNSRVYFTPDDEGTYYVAAGADGDHTGTYTLSVTEIMDDYAADPGSVAVDGSATGEIDYFGDEDRFAVELEAGTTYRFDLKGWNTGEGTLFDPYLRGIYDADGDRIANTTDDDSGVYRNSRVYFTPTEDATYYVGAAAVDLGPAGGFGTYIIGTYTLSVTDVTDDYAADTDTTGTVTVGGSATGAIGTPGDEDWFAVELEAGTEYRIDLERSPGLSGALRNPYLRGIHDADGDRIANTTDDDSGVYRNSRVYFTPTEDATYYVAAGADGNDVGVYTLSVEEGDGM